MTCTMALYCRYGAVPTNLVLNEDPAGSGSARGWIQGFGSGSGLDPYLIGPVDPDPYSESGSGSGSRRAKMTHKSRKKFVKVHVLKCWLASFES